MSKTAQRILWLEDQMAIQENAIAKCGIAEVPTHAYLLRRLESEWEDLNEKASESVLLELADEYEKRGLM